jgi:putative GTP pyrophosphokinase
MNESLAETYSNRYQRILVPTAESLERLLCERFRDVKRWDRIYARAKSPESFIKKAGKLESTGARRYDDPIAQIQDQIAARIILFFKDDVELATQQVLKYFTRAEQVFKEPESDWSFGYFGMHLILALPGDVVPDGVALDEAPRLFELQIRTLFQHAWSEANHDLGYKPDTRLSSEQTRRLAFTAAQAWGADQIFNEIHREQRNDSPAGPV